MAVESTAASDKLALPVEYSVTRVNLVVLTILGVLCTASGVFLLLPLNQVHSYSTGELAALAVTSASFFATSVYIASVVSAKLRIDACRLTLCTCFRERRIELQALTKIRRFSAKGTVTLTFCSESNRISFSSLTTSDRAIHEIEDLVYSLAEQQHAPLTRPRTIRQRSAETWRDSSDR